MKNYPNEISWEDVEVGKQYKFEEGHLLQAEVTILSKNIDDDYISFNVCIDKAIYGCHLGETTFGKTTKKEYSYLVSNMKFLSLDGWFSYETVGQIK